MANTFTIFSLVILLCVSAAGARTKLYSIDGHDGVHASSIGAHDSICKTMVETQGYICEEHTVTTQDGYILSMQRIPGGRSGKTTDKPPVLLQHGLIDARTWVLHSPDESLPFILADNGFDVWLVSTRGTKYSRGHTSLSPNDPDYWDWSWDELAAYDLPASFQFVHYQTGQKLHYVGHSQGTLIALAAFSQEKGLTMLRSAALLCPIAYLGQTTSPLARSFAEIFLAEALYWLGLYEFDPRSGEAVSKLLEAFCNKPGIDCTNLWTPIAGQNCCLNSSYANAFLEREPQPTATKNFIHYAQMIRQGTIVMYDYGNEVENMEKYGQPTPPVYNMASIPNEVPLLISYGGQDTISDVNDVQTLIDSLKAHDGDKLVLQYVEEYAHIDFIFGVNANQVVYNPLMAFFNLH